MMDCTIPPKMGNQVRFAQTLDKLRIFILITNKNLYKEFY